MKTYYTLMHRRHVRYFYDRSIRCWTVLEVTSPDDSGHQIGPAHYAPHKHMVDDAAEYAVLVNIAKA